MMKKEYVAIIHDEKNESNYMYKLRRSGRKLLIKMFIGVVLSIVAVSARASMPLSEYYQLQDWAREELVLEPRSQFTECTYDDFNPDPECTPGAVFADATREKVCTHGYSRSVRNVSEGTKTMVYAAYDITNRGEGRYQVDHFISLENGGSNDIANLWPQPRDSEHGYEQKIKSDNHLHDLLCKGEISLRQAQYLTVHRWYDVYQLMNR